jgi:hypothetical protein
VAVTWILFLFECESGGFETDGVDEDIEIVDDALVKAVELRSPVGFEPSVWHNGAEKACRERRIDSGESWGAWRRGPWPGALRGHSGAKQSCSGSAAERF